MATLSERPFTMFGGGPFLAWLRRLHHVTPSGTLRISWFVCVAWLPLVLGAALRMLFGRPPSPIVLDISVHVRVLVALPLLLWSTQLLEAQSRGAVRMLYDGELAEPAKLDPIFDAAARLRNNGWIELAIGLVALAIGQLGLWGVLGPTGVFHGVEHHTEWSFARVWYGTISLPLFQFLSLRWMYRWAVWSYVLLRLSRLPLAATASHPDHAAGLSCLAWPVVGYDWYVAAFSAVLSGAWATQLIDHRVTVPHLWPTVTILVIGAIIVGYAPLLVFTPQLYAVKRQDLLKNMMFGLTYTREFDAKWLTGRPQESPLGVSDIQSLNDLGGAFQVVASTRVTVFSVASMKGVVIAVVLPLIPLIATVVPLESVVKKLMGGLIPL
jgi:hypothetical protein